MVRVVSPPLEPIFHWCSFPWVRAVFNPPSLPACAWSSFLVRLLTRDSPDYDAGPLVVLPAVNQTRVNGNPSNCRRLAPELRAPGNGEVELSMFVLELADYRPYEYTSRRDWHGDSQRCWDY